MPIVLLLLFSSIDVDVLIDLLFERFGCAVVRCVPLCFEDDMRRLSVLLFENDENCDGGTGCSGKPDERIDEELLS